MKNKVTKTLSIIGKVLLLIVFSYLVFYLVFDKVSPHRTAKAIGYKTYNILSGSMEPTLNKGDLIIVVKHDFDDLNEGDIVTFVDPNQNVVTHRFVRYEEKTLSDGKKVVIFRTQPERNSDGTTDNIKIDPWQISEDNFIGKYKFKIVKVGGFVMFLQSWVGIAIFFVTVVLIIVIVEIIKAIRKESAKERKSIY